MIRFTVRSRMSEKRYLIILDGNVIEHPGCAAYEYRRRCWHVDALRDLDVREEPEG